jgi:hypothetical protein
MSRLFSLWNKKQWSKERGMKAEKDIFQEEEDDIHAEKKKNGAFLNNHDWHKTPSWVTQIKSNLNRVTKNFP